MSNTNRRGSQIVYVLLMTVVGVSASAQELASEGQRGTPAIQVNPIPQARLLAAPPPGQPNPLSPRALDLADRLPAAVGAMREAKAGKDATRAKEREEVDVAVEKLRARVGPSFRLRFREQGGTPMLMSGDRLHGAVPGLAPGLERDVATVREFLRTNRKLFALEDPDGDLTVTKKSRDRLNVAQVRLEQSYQGIPVWPSELLVHVDSDGNVHRANGSLIRTPKHLSTKPTVNKEAAAGLARKAVEAGEGTAVSDPLLIIYASDEHPPRLGWKIEVRLGAATHWLVVVDAHTGTVLTKFNQVTDTAVPGSGVDLFGVTRNISVWDDAGTYYLIDANKPMFDASQDPVHSGTSGAIYVVDAANTPSDPDAQQPDQLLPVFSSNPMGFNLPDAVSASYNLSQVYDYYLDRHGRDSFDGKGASIVAVVRLGPNYPNAFWDGHKMAFGDAEPYAGALDVVAHELTHAVINHSANLVYQGESGALNEAFADILGEMVEARTDGAPDWLLGSRLNSPIRSMRDPSLFDQPTSMSEFVFTQEDNGGVHTNSGVINHAYYLLAEGLPGAIGIADAEQIFYRALTGDLFKNAKFIDARHACIAAAEELFGSASTQAAKVAEAFDAVEIFDAAPSAPPTPFPEVQGPDSTLFVFFDTDVGAYRLGRRESALGDGELGAKLSASGASLTRPSVSGDGSYAVFVDSTNDVCIIQTDGETAEECVGFPGTVHSVAMSPQGDQFAVVLLDEFGEPDNLISIVDVDNPANDRDIVIRAPLIDGGGAVQVDSADAMAFSSSGTWLFYDAFNEVDIGDGLTFGTWSIYAIDLTTDLILSVVPPIEGLNFAYPALSKTSDNFLAFDAFDAVTEVSVVFTMNLFTGDLTTVGVVDGGYGAPSFTGDDGAVVYSQSDTSPTGLSLVRQQLAPDTMVAVGEPTIWLEDADFGTIYRRGEFQAPSEVDNCPNDPNKSAPGICGCGVLDADRDGDGVVNCLDDCPDDPDKTERGVCGCGVPENACGTPGPTGGCGAGVGMILLMVPVLGMLRFASARRRRMIPASY